jgi:hypothetical protein
MCIQDCASFKQFVIDDEDSRNLLIRTLRAAGFKADHNGGDNFTFSRYRRGNEFVNDATIHWG